MVLASDDVPYRGFSLTSRKSTNNNPYILKVYKDDDYYYFCEALPTAALTDASWRIERVDITGDNIGSSRWVDQNTRFDNVATSLAVVAALDYS